MHNIILPLIVGPHSSVSPAHADPIPLSPNTAYSEITAFPMVKNKAYEQVPVQINLGRCTDR